MICDVGDELSDGYGASHNLFLRSFSIDSGVERGGTGAHNRHPCSTPCFHGGVGLGHGASNLSSLGARAAPLHSYTGAWPGTFTP